VTTQTLRLINQLRELFSLKLSLHGIFAAHDLSAVGAIEEHQSAELKVPSNVRVIGYDGSAIAEDHTPAISTIAQSPLLLGQKVAEKVMRGLEGDEFGNEEIEVKLIVRESS